MKKKVDYHILKQDLLSIIFKLISESEPNPVDFDLIIEKMHEKYPSVKKAKLMMLLFRFKSDGYILTKKNDFDPRLYVRDITEKGFEAHILETFIHQSKKEKRASRNETGQIISPYIALAALLITTVFFIVDKCSTPTSYEITIDEKVYHLKQK